MAAPTVTARVTPVGIPLKDGYVSHITFAADPDVSFWERSIQPPAMDGGDPINLTSMFNNTYETYTPQSLIKSGPVQVTALYDPAVYSQIQALININTSVTILLADGTTICFWGYLQRFEPDVLEKGKEPTCKITVIPTNFDSVNNVESDPVITSVAGS